MKLEYDTKSRARYGFTWRGVKRPHDREMGIAGGELIVLDLQTKEVMGVRRGYNAFGIAVGRGGCARATDISADKTNLLSSLLGSLRRLRALPDGRPSLTG